MDFDPSFPSISMADREHDGQEVVFQVVEVVEGELVYDEHGTARLMYQYVAAHPTDDAEREWAEGQLGDLPPAPEPSPDEEPGADAPFEDPEGEPVEPDPKVAP